MVEPRRQGSIDLPRDSHCGRVGGVIGVTLRRAEDSSPEGAGRGGLKLGLFHDCLGLFRQTKASLAWIGWHTLRTRSARAASLSTIFSLDKKPFEFNLVWKKSFVIFQHHDFARSLVGLISYHHRSVVKGVYMYSSVYDAPAAFTPERVVTCRPEYSV